MAHTQTQKTTLYTLPILLLALFILAACGGATPSVATGGNNTPGGVDCTVRGNAFDAVCRNDPVATERRVELCSGAIADLTAAGGSRAACDTVAFVDTICVSSGANANPFAPICISERTRTLEVTLTIYEVQEKYCTETNFFDHSCTGALVECDDNDVCSDPVNALRLTACTSYNGTNATTLTDAGGTVASCDSPLLAGVICGTATSTGTNPFAAICLDAMGNSDSANIADRQIAYCSENTTTGTCPTVISTFCQTADGAKSQTLCPSQYAAATTAPATVTAVASKAKTRNVADTAEATVLDEIEGGAYTSYVDAIAGTAVGGITRPTFNFGGAVDGVGDVSIIQEGLLLSELVFKESDEDTASKGLAPNTVRILPNVANDEGTELANIGNTDGFAIARVDNPAFSDNPDGALDTKARFYAGLLTTTDLGAPLTDTSADGIWTAEFVAIVSDSNSEGRTGRRIATRSTLRVSFADKTIQTREVADTYSPEVADPTDFYDGISTETNDAGRLYNIAGSRITINGRFNAEGVISGESSWIYDGKTSRGSVSGLIGIEGAVGAFVSNGQNNGVNSNGEYAGGFVASNECAIIPFHASCADRHFQGLRDARIGFCADGTQSTNPLCMQTGVTAITTPCAADPFASACSPYATQYETARNTRLDICRGDNHASVTCTSIMTSICNFDYDPFAPICVNNMVNQNFYCQSTNPFDKTNCIDGKENDEVIDRQRLFCSGRDLVNAQTTPFYTECTRTIQGFCGTGTVLPEPISNLFSGTCSANNFNVARGAACAAGYNHGSCGDDTTSGTYIYAYCAAGSAEAMRNARDCGNTAYLLANPVDAVNDRVTVATFTSKALNGNTIGLLRNIVAEGAASLANANTNFITGGANKLDLGLPPVMVNQVSVKKTVGARSFRLNELGNNDNVTSGFALATGLIDSAGTDVTKHYVGLLSGTNLGAPLSDAAHSGTWNAKIHVRISKIDTNDPFTAGLNLDFKLNVDFATKTLKIVDSQGADTTVAFPLSAYEVAGATGSGVVIHSSQLNPVFSITNGKFTANGVIYGTTNLHARFKDTAGTLTGLIGQDGAVAIFKSEVEDTRDWDYVGGFIATPTAFDPLDRESPVTFSEDFTKWAASFDEDGVNESQTLRNLGFTAIDLSSYTYTHPTTGAVSKIAAANFVAEYIRLNKGNKILANNRLLDTTVVRLNETENETGYESGFAYASHTATAQIGNGATVNQAYVGLLPTTDVGVPLSLYPEVFFPTNVVWTGRIEGTFGGNKFSHDDFQLNISYGAVGAGGGKITTPIFGGAYYHSLSGFQYFSTPTLLPIPAGNGSSISVDGAFNSAGVISGSVGFTAVISRITGFKGGSPQNGTLAGLIGQSGAVAVFNGAFSNHYTGGLKIPFAGGFAIAPKSCVVAGNCVVFATWENSFGAGGANAGNILRAAGYEATARTASAEYTRLGRANRINEIPIVIPGGNKAGDTATAKTLRLNNIHEGGYESGVVYAHKFDRTASPTIAQIYAGLLPTTNLGAPLTDTTQNGTWTGRLEGYDGAGASINDTAFALKVTFTGTGGTIASVSTGAPDVMLTEGGFGIAFDGAFNSRGVIAGTTTGSNGNSATGTFSGLIAEKGAVGVFRGIDSSSPTGGYGGGFVVCPYGDADSRCQR